MRLRLLPAFLLVVAASSAIAGPADYVNTPIVVQGERELDFKIGHRNGDDRLTAASLGLGYGVTNRWFTEVYAKYERPGGEGARFDAFEWENRFQLTEQGMQPYDIGFLVEIERPRDRAEGTEVRVGPLFQTDIDRWQLNVNVLVERHLHADEPGRTELGYQWQVRYNGPGSTDFGLQGFGEVGPWNHWSPRDEQSHRAGPAIFGKHALGGRNVIVYNAAVLFGLNRGAPDRTVRAQVEYEF